MAQAGKFFRELFDHENTVEIGENTIFGALWDDNTEQLAARNLNGCAAVVIFSKSGGMICTLRLYNPLERDPVRAAVRRPTNLNLTTSKIITFLQNSSLETPQVALYLPRPVDSWMYHNNSRIIHQIQEDVPCKKAEIRYYLPRQSGIIPVREPGWKYQDAIILDGTSRNAKGLPCMHFNGSIVTLDGAEKARYSRWVPLPDDVEQQSPVWHGPSERQTSTRLTPQPQTNSPVMRVPPAAPVMPTEQPRRPVSRPQIRTAVKVPSMPLPQSPSGRQPTPVVDRRPLEIQPGQHPRITTRQLPRLLLAPLPSSLPQLVPSPVSQTPLSAISPFRVMLGNAQPGRTWQYQSVPSHTSESPAGMYATASPVVSTPPGLRQVEGRPGEEERRRQLQTAPGLSRPPQATQWFNISQGMMQRTGPTLSNTAQQRGSPIARDSLTHRSHRSLLRRVDDQTRDRSASPSGEPDERRFRDRS